MLHKFEFDGTKIVLDVHSGSVHLVDDLVWDLLEDYHQITDESLIQKYGQKYGRQNVLEAVDEIKALEDNGLLFSPDPYQETYSPSGKVEIKSLCLHLAHSCNLRCIYCFAGQGKFGGAAEMMALDTGRKAIDFLIARSGGRKHLEVDFFGGEPLLNFDVLKELVDYCRKRGDNACKEFSFTLTTNAVLLDEEVTRYLNDQNINVVLSLDGRREVHDAMRLTPGGKGSYDMVLPRIKSFLKSRVDLSAGNNSAYTIIRGTYTRHNLDFCSDVLHLADLGFEHLSVEPVVATEEAVCAIRDDDLPLLYREYERLTRELLQRRQAGKQVNFFHFNIDLDGGPCLPKRLCGCGAGHEYMAVAPNGDLYPCHQFVGRSGYLIGNVAGKVFNTELMDTFRMAHVYNKEECAGCWAKFYCSGGCHANAELFNGSILKPYSLGCALTRKRLECAIYFKVTTGLS